MKLLHIKLLQCIECGGTLELVDGYTLHMRDNFIDKGILQCLHCDASFPIIEGVGIFFKKTLFIHFLNDYEKGICDSLNFNFKKTASDLLGGSLLTKQVADNWSYQWNTVSPWKKNDLEKDDLNGVLNFGKFIRIEPQEYTDKKIIVWCGGNGREAYHISKNKPRLLIVNEIGDEIYRINGLIDQNVNLLLIRCDMLFSPLRSGIADISICDHALQHIIDKRGAFSTLANVLSPGGIVAVCVYSYENNLLMTHIIEPLKGIIHKMTLDDQKFISFFPGIFLFLLIKLFYLPAKYLFPTSICRKIPLFDHMMFWSKGSFRLIRISCFDLIHAPVSYYFKKEEVRKLAQQTGLRIDKLINTHGTTWSMVAKKQ